MDSPSIMTDKPPTTMTLHLSNVLSHGGGPYQPGPPLAAGGLSSVNTTSHNLCTATNNTMLNGAPAYHAA